MLRSGLGVCTSGLKNELNPGADTGGGDAQSSVVGLKKQYMDLLDSYVSEQS